MLKKFDSHSADSEMTKYDGALCNVEDVKLRLMNKLLSTVLLQK